MAAETTTAHVLRMALARRMKTQRVTVEELAKRIGLHPVTLSNIRNGRQRPTPITAMLIADALGTTADALELGKGGAQ